MLATATAAFADWLDRYDKGTPPKQQLEGDLDAIRNVLGVSDTVFRLRDLGDNARHDFGFVVGDYEEFAVVDLDGATLWLVAAGDD